MFVYLQKQQQLTLTKQLPDMNLTKIQKLAICEEILKDIKNSLFAPNILFTQL
jgi:hypothetical protein